jgi:TonB-dependent receptor
LGTASAVAAALAFSGGAHAQSTPVTATTQTPTTELEEIVITVRRQALDSATDRKKSAESMIDSIVADQAGMLPDASMTEVLQRVSGVSIVRFAALGDPDRFSAEGSGLQVRGLSGVAGRLNGREIFSANNGRGLSWTDVTPELMSAVDVYKSPTADQIEGGTGGQIDLRTKLPFDFSDGAKVQLAANASYGDLAKKTTPGGSVLASNRWNTGIGEIGVLVDLAYSKFEEDTDFIRMEPFYRTRVGTSDKFIPGGYDYGIDYYTRKRDGIYAAAQWKPSDQFMLTQTLFQSKYDDSHIGSGLFVTSKNLAVSPTGNNRYDSIGALISSDNVYLRDTGTFLPAGGTLFSGGNTGVSKGGSQTRDATTSFKWNPNEKWEVNGGVQFTDSKSTRDNYDVFPGVPFPGSFGLDISGSLPRITTPASGLAAFSDPSQYEWDATMDHKEQNHGHLFAANMDLQYQLSADGLFRSVQFGARYADRTERDLNSGYNWTALGRGWNGSPQLHYTDARPGDVEARTFQDFFRGEIPLPGNTIMPSFAMANRFDPVGDHAYYGGNPVNPIQFGPGDLLEQKTVNTAAYGMLRFASDHGLGDKPIDGNVGLRVVRIANTSSGFLNQKDSGDFRKDGVTTNIKAVSFGRSDGRTVTKALPALNFRVRPTDTLHVRLAYSLTLDQASFTALRANGSVGVRTTTDITPVPPGGAALPPLFDGFTTDSGNPLLLPVIAHNTDLSVEWYPTKSSSAHVSLFHKSIDNWIVFGNAVQPVLITNADGSVTMTQASSDNVYNATEKATIKGIEFGGRTFFDMLPAPWNGFGVEANYTYIDSKNPGDRYLDIDGVKHTDAPVQGLSKNNYNVQLMFEKSKVSLRLAYSWRSQYLMSTNSNGTNGDYTYYSAPNVGQFVDISLPVYSDAYGQLDFGSTWRPNEKLALSLDFNNLTNSIAKTLQGGYPSAHELPRSWYMSDRRVNFTVRYNF